jgi:hypothetical protein
MSSELSFPPKFSGAAQLQLFTRYGDPEAEGFAEKWITPWDVRKAFPWFPKQIIHIHKHYRPMLDDAFRALEMAALTDEIKSFDGGFDLRCIKGSNIVLSMHSWGCAIDMNAAQNPLGSEGTWSKAFLKVMADHLIFCGQEWTGRKDPMHFAMING